MRCYKPYTIRFAQDFWRYKLTPAGRYLFLGICFAGLGSVSVVVPIYQVFTVMVSLLVVAWMVGLAVRPRLEIRGQLPDTVSAGHPVSCELTVTNTSRRPALDVMLTLPGLAQPLSLLDGDRRFTPALWRCR